MNQRWWCSTLWDLKKKSLSQQQLHPLDVECRPNSTQFPGQLMKLKCRPIFSLRFRVQLRNNRTRQQSTQKLCNLILKSWYDVVFCVCVCVCAERFGEFWLGRRVGIEWNKEWRKKGAWTIYTSADLNRKNQTHPLSISQPCPSPSPAGASKSGVNPNERAFGFPLGPRLYSNHRPSVAIASQ